ncbi:MAG: 30S ribosomal protein S4e [Halobacteriaceae archaeon]
MTNHQKRLSVPESWPVERKTHTFTVKAAGGPHGESGVPLVVLLRDVLDYVEDTREARYAVRSGGVLVNGTPVTGVKRPIGMFDILAFPDRDEYYRVFPDEGGRLGLTPIDEADAASKLSKIEDKTVRGEDEIQLNLHDGSTLVVDEHTYKPGDSIVVDSDDDIVAHFQYEEGALVTAVDGKHAGEIGRIETIDITPGSSDNTVTVETDDGAFETIEDYIVVIDEEFIEEEGE